MQKSRYWVLGLLCMALLFGSGCQRKGIIPCPKPGKTSKVSGKNASGLEAVRVDMDKNGRVKKKRMGIF
ncbi:hypothetical protein I0P70_20640 [Pontibacter sp. FD36]|uniref:Lipoprotein n=1 Tax=Pontibacter lucknowensis TaxID=1077936 RepID=A0A1N6V5S2_9BACT|nr:MULTISPECIES: hypothetical protein [Pontibacter]EJF08982.1 hypothetical protein O71_17761 [Pontibacter sp. BAB1700]MBF8965672.1 hypothetical protein [Pontibacter sp. FD36]SIQ72936.1 hypothetical protein SAMN05421545_1237 [Pontibacter lucknowensis]